MGTFLEDADRVRRKLVRVNSCAEDTRGGRSRTDVIGIGTGVGRPDDTDIPIAVADDRRPRDIGDALRRKDPGLHLRSKYDTGRAALHRRQRPSDERIVQRIDPDFLAADVVGSDIDRRLIGARELVPCVIRAFGPLHQRRAKVCDLADRERLEVGVLDCRLDLGGLVAVGVVEVGSVDAIVLVGLDQPPSLVIFVVFAFSVFWIEGIERLGHDLTISVVTHEIGEVPSLGGACLPVELVVGVEPFDIRRSAVGAGAAGALGGDVSVQVIEVACRPAERVGLPRQVPVRIVFVERFVAVLVDLFDVVHAIVDGGRDASHR